MYRLASGIKKDAVRRWSLPDRVFFSCGACHILAHAFLERHASHDCRILWIRPNPGFTGNHIVVVSGDGWAFDYHGHTRFHALLRHTARKAARWWPGWGATLVELPADLLLSEARSKTVEGLWLREPGQFLHDPLPRARAFVARFPPPRRRPAIPAWMHNGCANSGIDVQIYSLLMAPDNTEFGGIGG